MPVISITPMLSFRDARAALVFYEKAFGAMEVAEARINGEKGEIAHAEIRIGDAALMLSDEFPEINVFSPESVGGSPVQLLLQVPDVDATFARALAAGATVERPVAGDALRNGKLLDPFGHRWMILTKK